MIKNSKQNIWIYKNNLIVLLTSIFNACNHRKCIFLSNQNAGFNLHLSIYIVLNTVTKFNII